MSHETTLTCTFTEIAPTSPFAPLLAFPSISPLRGVLKPRPDPCGYCVCLRISSGVPKFARNNILDFAKSRWVDPRITPRSRVPGRSTSEPCRARQPDRDRVVPVVEAPANALNPMPQFPVASGLKII